MKIILSGYGKMGHVLEELLTAQGHEIVGVVHPGLFASACDVPGEADLIVDFSYPGNLENTLARAVETGCAVVLGTTGLKDVDVEKIRAASKHAPIVFSSNYSLGVALMKKVCAMLAETLMPDFDCEIAETHHNQKADAPSGTAKTLLQAIDPDGEYEHVFGREGITGARGKEIGVHALRGGNIAGIHSVSFFGEDEVIEIKHTAISRKIFAAGAVKAANWVAGRAPGLYNMDDVIQASEE